MVIRLLAALLAADLDGLYFRRETKSWVRVGANHVVEQNINENVIRGEVSDRKSVV